MAGACLDGAGGVSLSYLAIGAHVCHPKFLITQFVLRSVGFWFPAVPAQKTLPC